MCDGEWQKMSMIEHILNGIMNINFREWKYYYKKIKIVLLNLICNSKL